MPFDCDTNSTYRNPVVSDQQSLLLPQQKSRHCVNKSLNAPQSRHCVNKSLNTPQSRHCANKSQLSPTTLGTNCNIRRFAILYKQVDKSTATVAFTNQSCQRQSQHRNRVTVLTSRFCQYCVATLCKQVAKTTAIVTFTNHRTNISRNTTIASLCDTMQMSRATTAIVTFTKHRTYSPCNIAVISLCKQVAFVPIT